jgi:hypothetical protein
MSTPELLVNIIPHLFRNQAPVMTKSSPSLETGFPQGKRGGLEILSTFPRQLTTEWHLQTFAQFEQH